MWHLIWVYTVCHRQVFRCYQFSLPATSFKTHGHVYSSCVQSAMLHASETWPFTKPNLKRLQWNDRAMIRQICYVKQDIVTTRSNASCTAWHWGSWPHCEGEKALLVWTCGMLQRCNQDSLSHTGWWKAWAWEAQADMESADREGLQRVEALGYWPSWQTPGDLCKICHVCNKPANWKGAHWCGCCPCTCMLIKNPMMMMMMTKD